MTGRVALIVRWRRRGCHTLGFERLMLGVTARINNPGQVLPDSMEAVQSNIKPAHQSGVPRSTTDLVHLRAGQVNGRGP